MKESRMRKNVGIRAVDRTQMVQKIVFCMTLIMLTVMTVMAGVTECFAGSRGKDNKSPTGVGKYPQAAMVSDIKGYVKASGNHTYHYQRGKERAAFWWEMPEQITPTSFKMLFQGTQSEREGCEEYEVWGLNGSKLKGVLDEHAQGMRTTVGTVNKEIKKTSETGYKDTYGFKYTYNET